MTKSGKKRKNTSWKWNNRQFQDTLSFSEEMTHNLTEDQADIAAPLGVAAAGTVADDGKIADGNGGWIDPATDSSTDTSSSSGGALDWLKSLTGLVTSAGGTVSALKGGTTATKTPPKAPATSAGMSPLTIGLIVTGIVGVIIAVVYISKNGKGAAKK